MSLQELLYKKTSTHGSGSNILHKWMTYLSLTNWYLPWSTAEKQADRNKARETNCLHVCDIVLGGGGKMDKVENVG